MPVVTDDEDDYHFSIEICSFDTSTTHRLLASKDIVFYNLRREITEKEIPIPFHSYWFMLSDLLAVSEEQEKQKTIRSTGKGRGTLQNPYQVIIKERFYFFQIGRLGYVKATKDATFHDLRREIVRDGIPIPFSSYEFCLTGSKTVQPKQEKGLIVRSTANMHGNGSGSIDDPYQVIIKESDELVDDLIDDLIDDDDLRYALGL